MSTILFGDYLFVLMASMEQLLRFILEVVSLVLVSLGFGDGMGGGGKGLNQFSALGLV